MRKQLIKHQQKVLALGDQVMVSGTNFVTGILITRFVGIENYGRFALYWMVFLFLQGLSNAYIGLPAQVLSNQAKNKANYLEENNRLGNLLVIAFFAILYPAFFIYDAITDTSFGYGYWIFPLVIVFFLKHEMNRKYFYAKQELKKVILIDSFTYLLQIPTFIFLFLNFNIDLNVILLIMATFSGIGQLIFRLIKNKAQTSFSFKNLPIGTNWVYGRHLISTTVLQWFSGNILLISAGSIVGVGAVGIIRVLQNIMGVLHVLFQTLENVVPVKASFLLNEHSKKHMFTYFRKVVLVTGILYGILLLSISLFGDQILHFVYGPEYVEYAYLLDLFIWVYALIFIGTIAQLIIKTLNRNHSIFFAYVASVIAALLLAKPLLESFQLSGVIIGFGILQLITLSVYFITIKSALK